MSRIRGGDIACGVTRGHASGDIAIDGQYGTGNIHAPGFTIGIHGCLVGLGTDFNRNRIARFNLITDFTRHRDCLAGLGRVNHVIAGDVINRN